jgi:hypothetical protein
MDQKKSIPVLTEDVLTSPLETKEIKESKKRVGNIQVHRTVVDTGDTIRSARADVDSIQNNK